MENMTKTLYHDYRIFSSLTQLSKNCSVFQHQSIIVILFFISIIYHFCNYINHSKIFILKSSLFLVFYLLVIFINHSIELLGNLDTKENLIIFKDSHIQFYRKYMRTKLKMDMENVSQFLERLKYSLKMTYSAQSTQQIMKAQQYIDLIVNDQIFDKIAPQLFIQLSTSQNDLSMQKSFILLLEKLTIDCYSKDMSVKNNYLQSQRILSLFFQCINNFSISFSIKRKLVKIIKRTLQFQTSQFKVRIMENIERKSSILPQVKQLLNGNTFSNCLGKLQIILLYGDIIAQELGFSTTSFAFSKSSLKKYRNSCLSLLHQAYKKQPLILQMVTLNLQIIQTLISHCQLIELTQIFDWMSQTQTVEMVKILVLLTQQNSKTCLISNIMIKNRLNLYENPFDKLETEIMNFYTATLVFFNNYQQKNMQNFYQMDMLIIYQSQIIPKIVEGSIKIIEQNVKSKPKWNVESKPKWKDQSKLTKLHKYLSLLEASLNFHCFYNLITKILNQLVDYVIIPLISFQQGDIQNRAEDYLNFTNFIYGNDEGINCIHEQQISTVLRCIKAKAPSTLPLQIIELQDQTQKVYNFTKLERVYAYSDQNATIFGCKKTSVQVLKGCLKKIDGFKAYFLNSIFSEIQGIRLKTCDKPTIFLLLVVVKQNISQSPQNLAKVLHFITDSIQSYKTQIGLNRQLVLLPSKQRSDFKEILFLLCTFRAYINQIYEWCQKSCKPHYKDEQWGQQGYQDSQEPKNDFKSYISILNEVLIKTNMNLFGPSKYIQQEEQNLTISLIVLNILRDIATYTFGERYVRSIFTTYCNILSNFVIDSQEVAKMQKDKPLIFLNTYFSLVDQIIQYFSFELRETQLLRHFVETCMRHLIQIYRLEIHQTPSIKILQNLLWRTLINIQAQRGLFQGLLDQFYQFIGQIVNILSINQILWNSIQLSECYLDQYSLIVAISLIKKKRKVSVSDIQLFHLVFEEMSFKNYQIPFSYDFQFCQCLLNFSTPTYCNETNEIIEQTDHVQKNRNYQPQLLVNSLQTTSIAYNLDPKSLQLMYKTSILWLKKISKKNKQLKQSQGIIILQSLIISQPQFLQESIKEQILGQLSYVFCQPNFYEIEQDTSLIQKQLFSYISSFTLLLLLMTKVKPSQFQNYLDRVIEINEKRKKMPNNFKYCTKLNVLVLVQLLQCQIKDVIFERIRKNFQSIKLILENPRQMFQSFQINIKKESGLSFILENSYQQRRVCQIFNLLFQCLQENFHITKKYDLLSNSDNQIILNFRIIETSILNRYTSMDQIQQLKSYLKGHNLDKDSQKMQNQIYEILNQILAYAEQDQAIQLIFQMVQICRDQFSMTIQLCICQASKQMQETIKSIIRTEKVNKSHRKIFKIK